MCAQMNRNDFEVIVIGGGQAGLACGWHLQRQGRDFVILDAQDRPGGELAQLLRQPHAVFAGKVLGIAWHGISGRSRSLPPAR